MRSVYSTVTADWVACWESLTALQRYSWCILQPKPSGPRSRSLTSQQITVGVFYSRSRVDHVRGVLPLSRLQLVYSTAEAEWTTFEESYLSADYSWCILQPKPSGPRSRSLTSQQNTVGVFYSRSRVDRVWGFLPLCRDAVGLFYSPSRVVHIRGVLPLCRDAVGVFYSLSWLGWLLGESYPSTEMQLVYSTVPDDWATLD